MKRIFPILFCLFTFSLVGQKAKPLTGLEVYYETEFNKGNPSLGLSIINSKSIYGIDIKLQSDIPSKMAEEFISSHAHMLGIQNKNALSIRHSNTRTSDIGHVVRHKQYYKDIRVKDTEITTTISPNNRVNYALSNLFEHVKVVDVNPQVTAKQATSIAKEHLGIQQTTRIETSELLIYPNKNGGRLAYEVVLIASGLLGEWHVMIDATTGELFEALDKAFYYCKHDKKCMHEPPGKKKKSILDNLLVPENGSGYVFDPDPLSSNLVNYGGGYSDNNDATSPELDAARFMVTLRDIDETGGTYTLKGPWAEIQDHDTPNKGLFQQNSPMFDFNREEDGFEAVTTYYHVDSMMRYINNTLGCAVQPYQYASGVRFDPSGAGGADQSFYTSGAGELTFGEGCVDDGEDSDVIHHELGHGLHDWLTNGGLSQVNGLSEGFGDYVAQSYNRSLGYWGPSDPQYNWMFNWDGHNTCWPGRITNSTSLYPDDLVNQVHTDGQIFSTCMMRILDQLGREKTDKAVFEGISMTNGSSSQNDAAVAIYQAAQTLGCNQAELTIIFDEMTATGYTLPAPPAPPVASFTPTTGSLTVCPDASGNGQITFFDSSSNLPSSWNWTFSGTANPTTVDNTVQNPVVTFTNAGTINAMLTVMNSEGDDTASEVITVMIYASCNISCQTYTNDQLGISIEQNGSGLSYSDVISSSGFSGQISDVNITNLNVDHTYTGDLTVTLTSPSTTDVVLVSGNCGTDENIDIGFDDEATGSIPCPMIGGMLYMPQGSLADFFDEGPNGDWTMTIVDNANLDGGTWNSWEIEICSLEPILNNSCVIDAVDITNVQCSDNDTTMDPSDDEFTFDLTVTATNGDPSGFTLGGGLSGTSAYGVVSNQGAFPISGGDINFTVTDFGDANCTENGFAEAPQVCSGICSIDQITVSNILCSDNGTSSDPSDDTYTFDVTVSDLNGDPTGFTFGGGLSGTGTYGSIISQGPFAISGGDINFTVTDNGDSNCEESGSATAPATCSDDCLIDLITVSNIVCADNGSDTDPSDDTYTFDVTVNTTNGDPTGFIFGGGLSGMGAYGTIISQGPFPISTGDINFTVTDMSDSNCTDSQTAVAPATCSDVDPCSIHVDLTGLEAGILDVEAKSIQSNQTINSTARVDYDAIDYILMTEKFNVELGAVFHAFIDGCNNGNGGVN